MSGPVAVPPAVSGKARITIAELRSKLGRVAFLVLQVLWARRTKTGEVTITDRGMGNAHGFERFSMSSIKKALERLRAASLISAIGWQKRRVPEGRTFTIRDVYVRRAFGALADPRALGERPTAFVPAETINWAASAATWGGTRERAKSNPPPRRVSINKRDEPQCCGVYFARSGDFVKIGFAGNIRSRLADLRGGNPVDITLVAYLVTLTVGRARTIEGKMHERFKEARHSGEWFTMSVELTAYLSSAETNPVTHGALTAWASRVKIGVHQEGSTPPRSGSTPTRSRGIPDLSLDHALVSGVSDLLPSVGDTGAVHRSDLPSGGERNPITAMVIDDLPKASSGHEGALVEGGVTRARPLVLVSTPHPGVPSFPGISLLGAAIVPPPPLLAAELTDIERAETLANVFRRVVENRTKQRYFGLRGVISQSKQFKTLVKAAGALIDRKIAPAAWIGWMLDTGIDRAAERGEPYVLTPLPCVLSAKAIREPRGWFTRIAQSYAGGRMIIGRRQRTLFDRYARMRAALDVERAWGNPGPVVNRFFPEGFDQAVEDVKEEIAADQEHVRERVAKGEVFW